MKRRIVVYSIFLGLLTVLTCFGLFTLILNPNYTNNNVTFTVKNDEAYFQVVGKYYYGEVAEPTNTYTAKYIQEDVYKGEDTTIEAWDIGESVFVRDDQKPEENKMVLKYVLVITNKNRERNLSVKLNNVAVHKDKYFLTKIEYDNDVVFYNTNKEGESQVGMSYYKPNDLPNAVNIDNAKILSKDDNSSSINNSFTVTITMLLNTRTKPFNIANNFNFVLESVGA